MENSNKRIISLDILRILACFLVILRHVLDGYGVDRSNFRITLVLHSFSHTALPFFFMISGYFLLEYKDESLKTFFSKRFKRILIPFLFWSFIYIIYLNKFTPYKIGYNFIKLILTNGVYVHFWYVYYIIGVYLAIPLVRKLMKVITYRDLIYIICIWFCLSIINPILTNLGYGVGISFLFIDWWGYIILGYAIKRVELTNDKYRKALIILCLTYLIITLINCSTVLTRKFSFIPISAEMSIPIFLITTSTFYIFIYKSSKLQSMIPPKIKNIIICFSNLTYSIYLLHNLFVNAFINKVFGIALTPTFINPLYGAPIEALIIFIICAVIIFVGCKIPILKKVIL